MLLLVLNKLAVQDPLSLLRFSCLSKSLYSKAANDVSLWRKAFHGPELFPDVNCTVRLLCDQQIAKLEASLFFRFSLDLQCLVSVYKELVAARWRFSTSSAHRVSAQERESREHFVVFLLVVRKGGSLFLWGTHGLVPRLELLQISSEIRAEPPLLQSIPMQRLYQADKVKEAITGVVRRGTVRDVQTNRCLSTSTHSS